MTGRRRTARSILMGSIGAVAAAGIVVGSATPAAAATLVHSVYGNSGTFLGWGRWQSLPAGNGNGKIEVWDDFADGQNGIIAAIYRGSAYGGGLVNLVSVRSATGTGYNYNFVKSTSNGGPLLGERIKFVVCKLPPDGVWKDCYTDYAENVP